MTNFYIGFPYFSWSDDNFLLYEVLYNRVLDYSWFCFIAY